MARLPGGGPGCGSPPASRCCCWRRWRWPPPWRRAGWRTIRPTRRSAPLCRPPACPSCWPSVWDSTALALLVMMLRPAAADWLWLPSLAGFLAVLALVVAPLGPLLDRERQLPLRQMARTAQGAALPGEPLWIVGTKRYSILFYGEPEAVFVSDRLHVAQLGLQRTSGRRRVGASAGGSARSRSPGPATAGYRTAGWPGGTGALAGPAHAT